MTDRADVVVVGGGAAGLMAGVWAARSAPAARVVVLEGARKHGTKILIAGGGRCNVTNELVRPDDFAGSSRNSIRKVLGRFDVARTVAFFADLGVELKLEERGKLFPITDRADSVLRALVAALADSGAKLVYPRRVTSVERTNEAFTVAGEWGSIESARVILATGGRSLPSSGSDGGGYAIARSLGHTLTPEIFPALVPLVLGDADPLRALAGVSAPVALSVRSPSGKRLATCAGALLCTHFGVSGPAVLDVSRHLTAARTREGATLVCDWLPSTGTEDLDAELRGNGAGTMAGRLRGRLPERLARALCERAGVDPSLPASRVSRESRRAIVRTLKEDVLDVHGSRGWNFAEVTAGGVPLAEVDPATMQSRSCPGLHLCGEICDVDGRIGGFNFQWAWASGFVGGTAAAGGLGDRPPQPGTSGPISSHVN